MAHDPHSEHGAHGSDRTPAFLGLVIGAIVLFGVLRTIVYLTNGKYENEKPAAAATK